MEDFQLRRIRMVMEPETGNPNDIEGVLDPVAARGPNGDSISSRGWWRREITPASASRG